MEWSAQHAHSADSSFDGGDLDCGNGLLLLIRKHLDPLQRGQLLEIRSTEVSVDEDLPAWARLTGNELVSRTKSGGQRSFLVCKGPFLAESRPTPQPRLSAVVAAPMPLPLSNLSSAPLPPFAVMGIGSWPRPRWMVQAIHEHLETRLDETTFQQTADDAVRLAIAAQERAGVDVISDGEQRRDNYASFVGSRLVNCQMVPLTDLLAYVDDPTEFETELRALDVPADTVRHPAVLGALSRSQPLTLHELAFARSITMKPVKVALPGPYLLTRTMWLECVADRFYQQREALANDLVRILREEIADLLAGGATLVQLDEPVLSEVVFGHARQKRSFMCGALSGKGDQNEELAFAELLINRVVEGFPPDRLALHMCRGNWSRDESVALAGDYRALLPLLGRLQVGTLFLEMCTPRAGEIETLGDLPERIRVGLGVANPKSDHVETPAEIVARAAKAIALLGPKRVWLNPDCGFATFADNPVASAQVAEAKLRSMVQAAELLREKHG